MLFIGDINNAVKFSCLLLVLFVVRGNTRKTHSAVGSHSNDGTHSAEVGGGPTKLSEMRISQKKCLEYQSGVKVIQGDDGYRDDPATRADRKAFCDIVPRYIVGGRQALVGEFPFMAVVGWPTGLNDGSPEYKWLCGGTLISENYILSAGHCTFTSRTDITSSEPTVVRLGDIDLRQSVKDFAFPQTYEIRKIIKHPEYKPPRKYNDLALFQIDRIEKFNFYIRPACLWREQMTYDEIKYDITATGWGVVRPKDKEPSDTLMKVYLQLFNNSDCGDNFPTNRNWGGFVDTQICGGDLTGQKDTCQGDSGGPLTYSSNNDPGGACLFHLVAVTSFGGYCGSPNGSGVYTKVYPYLEWIEEQVWPQE